MPLSELSARASITRIDISHERGRRSVITGDKVAAFIKKHAKVNMIHHKVHSAYGASYEDRVRHGWLSISVFTA